MRSIRLGVTLATALVAAALSMPAHAAGDAVAAVAGGDEYFMCAQRTDRSVWCWGDNSYGQIGDGTEEDPRSTPVRVTLGAGFLQNVVQLSLGTAHACAVRASGTVACFGDNSSGQLGTGDTDPATGAVVVVGLSDVDQVAAGQEHSCALKSNGTVWCWGGDSSEGLGNGAGGNSLTPVQVQRASGPLTNIVAISARLRTTCALAAAKTVRCWGENTYHALTDGTTDDSGVAKLLQLGGSTMDKVTKVDVGYRHQCVIRAGGKLYCWGDNESKQLGDGTEIDRTGPVRVKRYGGGLLENVVEVDAGDGLTCAIAGTGALAFCFGANGSGQLGIGSAVAERGQATKVIRGNGSTIEARDVAAIGSNACVLRKDRALFCMGDNADGVVGNGDTEDVDVATRVLFPS